jgi:23S rRNA-/tRNA-specific pseudouridylate synthase
MRCVVASKDKNDEPNSLLVSPYDFEKQAYICEGFGSVYSLNRLDASVSGLVPVGLNSKIAEAVKSAFESMKISKQYVALVKRYPRSKNAVWRFRLDKSFVRKSIKISSKDGVFAETKCSWVESFRACGVTLSILNFFPVTGRTHRLRMDCSQNSLPIVGDETYEDFRLNMIFGKRFDSSRLFLYSEKIFLAYALEGKIFTFHTDSMTDFSAFLKKSRKKQTNKFF